MNAILFAKDGTTRTVENVSIDTYFDIPVYVPNLLEWRGSDLAPCALKPIGSGHRMYRKQIESKDYAVFVEE